MVFEFTSEGPHGQIPKLIKFSETTLKDFYNLAFGDKDNETGEIDDKVVSNNGDSEQVLATVVSAVYSFFLTTIKIHGFMLREAQKPAQDFIEWVLQNTFMK